MKRVLLKLSGEALAGEKKTGLTRRLLLKLQSRSGQLLRKDWKSAS